MKKKTNYSVYIWLLVGIMYLVVLPILSELRINQLSRQLALMELQIKLLEVSPASSNAPDMCFGRLCDFGQPAGNIAPDGAQIYEN